MTQFALEPIYGSLPLAILLVVVTVTVVLWVTPPTADPRRRITLIGLRLLAAIVLMLSFLRPAVVRTDSRPADASLVVALDVSKSMTLSDGDGSRRFDTQLQVAKQLVSRLSDLTDRSSGTNDSLTIKLLTYGDQTRSLATEALVNTGSGAIEANAPTTDLNLALTESINLAQGQPMTGIVLVGDGNQTAPVQGGGPAQVARTLDAIGVALWTIAIGPPPGSADMRDVAVDSLSDSFQLFAGNQVDIRFQVQTRGLLGVDIPLRLSWVDSSGKQTEFATRTIRPVQPRSSEAVTVLATAPEPGTYQLVVQADEQDGETLTANNRQIAFVDVREGGGRILYVEGALREEYKFLRRALKGFADLDLTQRWIPEDTQNVWPVDLTSLLEPGKFDIYILGDLDASALGTKQLQRIADAVDAGAGLITLGGYQAYSLGGYAQSPLAGVLPINMEPRYRRTIGQRKRGAANDPDQAIAGLIEQPITLSIARSHPITDLGVEDSRKLWRELPQQLGANKWPGVKLLPGTQTLLEAADGAPMMAIGNYGRGRVVSTAFDSTWRWWRSGRSDVHRRFWRQVILWLLSREDSDDDKIVIQMDQRRFASSEPPKFRATLESLDKLAAGTKLSATVVRTDVPNQTPLPIDTTQLAATDTLGKALAIGGMIPRLEPGIYELQVGVGDTNTAAQSSLAFQVVDRGIELARPMADPIFMQQLAQQTRDQGGKSFSPDEVEQLVEVIQARRRKAETAIVEKSRLGDGPKTGWPLFLVFVGALSTEWFLRRRWNLA